jgi:hypothetical protein
VLIPVEGETDPLEIALKELRAKKVPLVIRRYLPGESVSDSVAVFIISPSWLYRGHPASGHAPCNLRVLETSEGGGEVTSRSVEVSVSSEWAKTDRAQTTLSRIGKSRS